MSEKPGKLKIAEANYDVRETWKIQNSERKEGGGRIEGQSSNNYIPDSILAMVARLFEIIFTIIYLII